METNDKFVGSGYTYDDVLLLPAYSEVLPAQTDIKSYFSRNIQINIPIVSAAMDTVTDSTMAIALAKEGGIGVLHKNMSIEEQAQEVRRVKRSESGIITDPITLNENALVKDAHFIMREYKIGGIPIVNSDNILKGIITNRDLRFERNENRPISEIMTKENLITTKGEFNYNQASDILQQFKIEKLPVVDDNFKLVGLITYKDLIKIKTFPNSCKDARGRLRVAAAVGVSKDTIERVDALVENGVDAIVVDTAHGHSKGVIDVIKLLVKKYPNLDIVAGNIATGEAAIMLAEAGVSAVKVGIGPGSICTTRIIAGIGVPQLSAIYNVANALKGKNIPIIADGGIRYTGDIVKAIAAGASSIMAGSLFAGVEESPGNTVILEGRKYKVYRGMGSLEAMSDGSKDRYFQQDVNDNRKLVPEGIVGRVPFKGNLSEVIHQMIGGLKAGMGYTGSANIEQLKKAKFIKITNAGIVENHPHDVFITSEAPNYSR